MRRIGDIGISQVVNADAAAGSVPPASQGMVSGGVEVAVADIVGAELDHLGAGLEASGSRRRTGRMMIISLPPRDLRSEARPKSPVAGVG
jgi:hypothetical protein